MSTEMVVTIGHQNYCVSVEDLTALLAISERAVPVGYSVARGGFAVDRAAQQLVVAVRLMVYLRPEETTSAHATPPPDATSLYPDTGIDTEPVLAAVEPMPPRPENSVRANCYAETSDDLPPESIPLRDTRIDPTPRATPVEKPSGPVTYTAPSGNDVFDVPF
jgi:hypothetical protein